MTNPERIPIIFGLGADEFEFDAESFEADDAEMQSMFYRQDD